MEKHAKRILLIAGEASGDHHGAHVVKALKHIDPSIHVYGIGGEELRKEGMEILYSSEELAVVGILEVFSHVTHIIKAFHTIKKEILKTPPSLVLLLDYPDFNLRIANIAKKKNVPVLYYISPQIWAWRKGRAKKIIQLVDKMAVIFPFEIPFYAHEEFAVEFVGHPLLDQDWNLIDTQSALKNFHLKEGHWPIIGLLPGSRKSEIDRLLPPMLASIPCIIKKYPDAQFALPCAPGIRQDYIKSLVDKYNVQVSIISDNFKQVVSICDLVLVASGTATLETAIMEKQMIILYKVSLLTYLIGKMLISIPYIGLTNIVAGKKVVPELIQGEVTPSRIVEEVTTILDNPDQMHTMKMELSAIKKKLGNKGASRRVAQLACEMMSSSV
ncbi:MAG: lipid-A-disaccharide synthase [bacterium]